MQKLLLICLVALSGALMAQPIYVDQFDDGEGLPDTDKFDFAETNGELLISGNGTNGDFDGIWIQLPENFDVTASPKLYIRARSSILGTVLRADLTDGTNFTNMAPIQQTLTDNSRVLEYDFSTVDVSNVDLTAITAVFVFINPGSGGFGGQVAFDYIALGEEPEGVIMSDVYQDLMDSDSSLANWINEVPGFTRTRSVDDEEPSYVTLVGDGTAGPWTPHVYALRPAPEYIQTNIDISDNPTLYVKARTNVDGTAMRFDVQDVDGVGSITNARTRVLTEDWAVYEYEYTGATQNFENEACPTAMTDPCPVNLEAIPELLVYVNGGTGLFAGTIDIQWVSVGVNLDGEGPEAPLMYSDHFDNERVDFAGGTEGIEVSETESSMFFDGNGTSGAFGTVSYDFNDPTDDQDTARMARIVDFSAEGGQGKFFVRARTVGADQPVRIDIVDSTGLSTNLDGLTKRFTNDWQVYEYDFTGNRGDAGFGGAEGCTVDMTCPLDMTAIRGVLFYPRPGEGLFEGQIEIDWISVGQPLEEEEETPTGVINYSDSLVGSFDFFIDAAEGVDVAVSPEGIATLSGDGSSPAFQQVRLLMRDEAGNSSKADVAGSGDKLFVRARIRNAESAEMRIDLVDERGFESTNAGAANMIAGEDFVTYEYDYAGRYFDGGYGGTSCPVSNGADPCDVDPQRITQINFYPSPATGMFDGDIDINWISFGQEISVNVRDFAELDALRLFPNPADNRIGVEYNLPVAGQVSVNLFDGLGRRVITRDFGPQAAGNNFHAVDVTELATGTYYLQVSVNGVPTRAQTIMKR